MNTNGSSRAANPQTILTEITTSGVLQKKTEAFRTTGGSCFSGPAWEYDKTTDMYFLHLFSKKQPDLNWDNPAVRQDVFDMMNWWLKKGVDGFRMDVISLISKEPGLPDKEPGINGYATFNVSANGPHVHEYLQEMRQKALNNADTITVGECSGVTLEEAKKYARSDEKELNMVFQFEHMDVDSDEKAGKWTTRKMDLRNLKKILTRWQKGLRILHGTVSTGKIMTSQEAFPVSAMTVTNTEKSLQKCLQHVSI